MEQTLQGKHIDLTFHFSQMGRKTAAPVHKGKNVSMGLLTKIPGDRVTVLIIILSSKYCIKKEVIDFTP